MQYSCKRAHRIHCIENLGGGPRSILPRVVTRRKLTFLLSKPVSPGLILIEVLGLRNYK
jgi:hypothetical protein